MAALIFKENLYDFRLRFRLKMNSDGALTMNYGASITIRYEIRITPVSATFQSFQGFGNASSSIIEKNLGVANLNLSTNNWSNIEISMIGNDINISVNGEVVISSSPGRRITQVYLSGNQSVFVDDLQIEKIDLSVNGQRLDTFSTDLLQTWIAYLADNNAIWLVHPDGSGKQQVAQGITPDWSLRTLFSPNGNLLWISKGNGTTSEFSFLDMNTLQLLSSRIKWGRDAQVDWLPDSKQIVAVSGNYNSGYGLQVFDVFSGKMIRQISLPTKIDTTDFKISTIVSINCSPKEEVV